MVPLGRNLVEKVILWSASWNDRPENPDTLRAFGGTLILIRKSINHYSLPTPPLQAIEATMVILTTLDQDPISIGIDSYFGNVTITWEVIVFRASIR
ncbi:hypothetical protein TNCV_1406391 [Trichonephila clavipes]|nr:hypothetical protein TNCV_1406391 [Trichonephila clavipes]